MNIINPYVVHKPDDTVYLLNTTFDSWEGTGLGNEYPTGWVLFGGSATSYFTENTGLEMNNDGDQLYIYIDGIITASVLTYFKLTLSQKISGGGGINCYDSDIANDNKFYDPGTYYFNFTPTFSRLRLQRTSACNLIVSELKAALTPIP